MFELDSRLAADCELLASLPLCELLLMNDASYPWLILVPRREALRELCELGSEDTVQFQIGSNAISKLLLAEFAAEKLNVAALGNLVPQLHIHHIARFEADPAWPRPVWGVKAAVPYTQDVMRDIVKGIRRVLPDLLSGEIDWRAD